MSIYDNSKRLCECGKCEIKKVCGYTEKYQRLGREHSGALGMCLKLEENKSRLEQFLQRHNITDDKKVMSDDTKAHYLQEKSNGIVISEHYTRAVEIHRSIITNAQLAQSSLYEMCRGIKQMKDGEFFKELGYETFENYCEKEFNLGRRQAYKYISIAENMKESFVQSTAQIGTEKLYLLSTLTQDEQKEITDVIDVNEVSVKQLKERIKEMEGKVDAVTQNKSRAEAEVQALSNVNSKLTEKSRTLESKVQELENRPVDIAVQEKEIIVPNEEYEAKIKALQEEYTQKLEQLKQDNKALTEQAQNVPEPQSQDANKIKFKVLLTSAFDAVKRASDFVQSTAQPEQDIFQKQLEKIKSLI